MSAAVDPDEIHRFFDGKVAAGVRSSTVDTTQASFSEVPPDFEFRFFRLLTTEDVVKAV